MKEVVINPKAGSFNKVRRRRNARQAYPSGYAVERERAELEN
jgi:hypothetical protein